MRKIVILADQLEELLASGLAGRDHKNLVRIISRSVQIPRNNDALRDVLMRLFSLDKDQGAAPFNMLADGLNPGIDYCIHADPICLYVDLARVFITRWGAGGLSDENLATLSEDLAEHFQAEGIALHTPCAERWYLRMEDPLTPGLPSPDTALGRDIGELIAASPGAEFWKKWLNESQMILHRNRINQQLASQGQPAVNSLWFWGGGTLPGRSDGPKPGVVQGSDNLLSGLARWAGVPVVKGFDEMLRHPEEQGIIMYSRTGGELGEELAQMEQFLAPLVASLKNGQIAKISLLGNQVTYELGFKDWRAFWRRGSAPVLADKNS